MNEPPAPGSHADRDLATLARGSALSFAGTVAKAVLGFVLVIAVTRGAGTRGAGLFFQAVALFTILEAARMGADTGLVRSISRLRALGRIQDVRPILVIAITPVVAITSAIAAVAFFAAPGLARILFEDDIGHGVDVIRVLAPFLPLAAVSDVLIGGTRGFGTVLPYVAIESVAKPLARPAFVILVLVAGMSSVATLVAWALPIALGLPLVGVWILMLLRSAEHAHSPLPPPSHYRPLAREFWVFAIPQGLASILQTSMRWLSIPLVGAMRSVVEAGVFAAVNRTALFGLFAIDALRIAIAPQVSALLARGGRARAESIYRVATWWLVLVSWPIYLALTVWSPVILRMFGRGFEAGQHALLISSLGMLLFTGTGNVSTLLLMGGHSGSVLFNSAAALAVNVSLNLLLVPTLGIEGAAIGWVVSIATGELLALAAAWRKLRIDPFGRGFVVAAIGPIGCYGVVGVAVRLVLGPSVAGLLVAVTIGTLSYVVFLIRNRATLQLAALWQAVIRRRLPEAAAADADAASGQD